ncbi:hypothetical protein ACFE04_015184 [Oxalis oulophora]
MTRLVTGNVEARQCRASIVTSWATWSSVESSTSVWLRPRNCLRHQVLQTRRQYLRHPEKRPPWTQQSHYLEDCAPLTILISISDSPKAMSFVNRHHHAVTPSKSAAPVPTSPMPRHRHRPLCFDIMSFVGTLTPVNRVNSMDLGAQSPGFAEICRGSSTALRRD